MLMVALLLRKNYKNAKSGNQAATAYAKKEVIYLEENFCVVFGNIVMSCVSGNYDLFADKCGK